MPVELGELKLYSLAELSEKLGVTKVTLRTYLRDGKIKGRKMGNHLVRHRGEFERVFQR